MNDKTSLKILLVGLGLLLVFSAIVSAHENRITESGNRITGWWAEMKEHHLEIHGDDFEEHHIEMHGEDWEEHVETCHADTDLEGMHGDTDHMMSSM
ncbi:MAG: hypothetical protein V3T58_05500 [Candidatus Hydrothermarchaeales archaeon]